MNDIKYECDAFDWTYSSWNKENGEQVPEAEEKRHYNGGNLVIGTEGYKHHTLELEHSVI